jgi:hypothetical protein
MWLDKQMKLSVEAVHGGLQKPNTRAYLEPSLMKIDKPRGEYTGFDSSSLLSYLFHPMYFRTAPWGAL